MSLHNRLDYAAEGRNICQTKIWAQNGCAEDTVEAVRVGVNCPEVRERTQEGGEEGGSGAVRKRVQRRREENHQVVYGTRKS